MCRLFILIAMIVAITASPLPAGSHEWYTGLRSPSGTPCCNERDCRPVAYRINRDTGREEIQANGAWYPVEYDKVLPFSSPDGGYHACWSNAAGRPDFRCIMLPGMASLPLSKDLARITPNLFSLKGKPPAFLLLAPGGEQARNISATPAFRVCE